MVILSDMPANNPLTTHVRNQSITISQGQCQKMMGLSKNKTNKRKRRNREVLKVQKMFPSILYIKNPLWWRVFAAISAMLAAVHSELIYKRVLLSAEYQLSVCQEMVLQSRVKCTYTANGSKHLQPKFNWRKPNILAYLVPNYAVYQHYK